MLDWLFIYLRLPGFEVVLLDLCVSVMIVSCFCWVRFGVYCCLRITLDFG